MADTRRYGLHVTRHCTERYIERVEPDLSPHEALLKVLRLVRECAEIVEARPDWIANDHGADFYLVVTDSIVFPVEKGNIITCLTRAGVGEGVREHRRIKRRGKRQRSRRQKLIERASRTRRERKYEDRHRSPEDVAA